MALKSDPEMGINSWLEDELYQQYLHDHGAVDESWKHVFEEPRQRATAARRRAKPAASCRSGRSRRPAKSCSPCAARRRASPRT